MEARRIENIKKDNLSGQLGVDFERKVLRKKKLLVGVREEYDGLERAKTEVNQKQCEDCTKGQGEKMKYNCRLQVLIQNLFEVYN